MQNVQSWDIMYRGKLYGTLNQQTLFWSLLTFFNADKQVPDLTKKSEIKFIPFFISSCSCTLWSSSNSLHKRLCIITLPMISFTDKKHQKIKF